MFPRRDLFRLIAGVAAGAAPLTRAWPAPAGVAQGDIALVDGITWGVNQSTMTAFQALGRDGWLKAQLHPPAGNRPPKAAQQQIDALLVSKRSAAQMAMDLDGMARLVNGMTDPEQRATALNSYQAAMNDMARQAAAVAR